MGTSSFPGVAVVTGAGGSGIGAGVAKAFAEAGCTKIAITDINTQGLQMTCEALKAISNDVQIFSEVGDISDEDFVQSFINEVFRTFSRIDYAVNCAGILNQESTRSTDMSVAEFDKINKVNYRGCWLSSRAEISNMLQQDPLDGSDSSFRGAIVNIASQLGLVARPGAAAYCASKSAIINMTRGDAIDYSTDGIRLNCVCPGIVETPMTSTTDDLRRALDKKVLKTPLKRMGTVKEVADSVLFLCSDKSSFIQGHALVVDGGYTIE